MIPLSGNCKIYDLELDEAVNAKMAIKKILLNM